MNILELAILKQMVGGGGGSGTDNYNDLSNLPQINGETLAGNKTSENLGLQDALTFDSAPTEDSTNPVESGGIYTALAGKQDNLTFDDDPTENSTNPVKSGGVYNALSGKQATLSNTQLAAVNSGIDSTMVQQIGVNQTNILYTTEKVGKNRFNFDAWKSVGINAGTKALGDHSITITATSDGCYTNYNAVLYPESARISVQPNEIITLSWDYVPNNSQTNDVVFIFGEGDTSKQAYAPAQTGYLSYIVPATGVTYITFRLGVATSGNSATYSNIMASAKSIYDADSTYENYALSNSDLTELQSEDRNALIPVIDNGAKNRFDFSNSTIVREQYVTTTKSSDNLVVACNSAVWAFASLAAGKFTGNSTFAFKISELSNSGASPYIRFTKNQDGSSPILDIPVSANGTYNADFIGDGSDYYICVYLNPSATSQTVSLKMSDIMICDADEYKVSPAVTPYALSNADLTQLEAQDREALAEVVDSGAKNLADFINGGTVYNATKTVSGNAFTLTTTGAHGRIFELINVTQSGNFTIACTISNLSVISDSARIIVSSDINANNIISNTQITSNGKVEINFNTSLTAFYVHIFSTYGNYSDANTLTISDFLLCTKAAFDVSPAFVPYKEDPFLTVPINHNMVYRGKNLGDTLTDAQHTALSSGNFTDLYLGDYWTKAVTIPAFYEVTTAEPSDWSTNYTSYYTKSGDTYSPVTGDTAPTWAANTYYERLVPAQTVTLKAVIADFDTFYAGYASSYAGINTHHAAVIVTGFSNVVWNKTNSTAGGYVASLIHKWLVGSALPQIETWFGSAKVLSHQKLLTNAITGDAASGWAWSSQKISLLSENQMYGSKIWGNSKAANGGYEPGEAFKHLNVFNHIDANLLFGNKNIWLRDIASAVWAADLLDLGSAIGHDASNAGIAPAALILLS